MVIIHSENKGAKSAQEYYDSLFALYAHRVWVKPGVSADFRLICNYS